MNKQTHTITRSKRQEDTGDGFRQKLITRHTISINGRETYSTRNPAFATAYEKGARARLAGEPQAACPYPDHRTHRGSVTFSRAFARDWNNGWIAADRTLNAR